MLREALGNGAVCEAERTAGDGMLAAGGGVSWGVSSVPSSLPDERA